MEIFLRPADRMCPLQVGDELFIDGPDAEENPELRFQIEVALNEPLAPTQGEPVLETLHQMLQVVENALPSFRPLL